jgi:hypothetical protein
MNNEKSDSFRKRLARNLYTLLGRTIRETALETDEDEATIRCWILEGEWDLVRKSNSISNQNLINWYYEATNQLTAKLKEQTEVNIRDVDLLNKYANLIKTLEGETGVCAMIASAERFITWLYRRDMALAQTFTRQFDLFIKERKAS